MFERTIGEIVVAYIIVTYMLVTISVFSNFDKISALPKEKKDELAKFFALAPVFVTDFICDKTIEYFGFKKEENGTQMILKAK